MSAAISLSKSEKSYIQTALDAPSPIRADGRSLLDYRSIALETGVASLANGSARVNIGKAAGEESGSGTEVIAAVKLEVEGVLDGDGVDGGRIVCTVSWFVSDSAFSFFLSPFAKGCKASSPAAYPHISSTALDDLSYDMTIILNQCLSHPSLHPKNLGIIPKRKSWLLNLDAIVLSNSGNVYDALFLAARSALWDTKVPKTRGVQYQPKSNVLRDQDVEMTADGSGSIFNTKGVTNAADFELVDYWDEGEPLEITQEWPVCVTLNLARIPNSIRRRGLTIRQVSANLPPTYFLDATPQEEAAIPLRLLLLFSFSPSGTRLQSMRLMGDGETQLESMTQLLEVSTSDISGHTPL